MTHVAGYEAYGSDQDPKLAAARMAGDLLGLAQVLLVGDAMEGRTDAKVTPNLLQRFIATLDASSGRLAELKQQLGPEGWRRLDSEVKSRGRSQDGSSTYPIDLATMDRRLAELDEGPARAHARDLIEQMEEADPGGASGGSEAPDPGAGVGNQTGTVSFPEPLPPPIPEDALLMPVHEFPQELIDSAQPHAQAVEGEYHSARDSFIAGLLGGGGGSGSAGDHVGSFNQVLTGIAIGAALSLGGWIGAALAALAAEMIPRMLASFEEAWHQLTS